jgi:hypothetical protein
VVRHGRQFRLGAVRAQSSVNVVLGQLLRVPPLGRHTLVAWNVCYVDVQAVWRVSHVVSGIRADTVSDVQPTVARIGLYKIMHAPHYHRAERLLRRRSGGVAHLPAS